METRRFAASMMMEMCMHCCMCKASCAPISGKFSISNPALRGVDD